MFCLQSKHALRLVKLLYILLQFLNAEREKVWSLITLLSEICCTILILIVNETLFLNITINKIAVACLQHAETHIQTAGRPLFLLFREQIDNDVIISFYLLNIPEIALNPFWFARIFFLLLLLFSLYLFLLLSVSMTYFVE